MRKIVIRAGVHLHVGDARTVSATDKVSRSVSDEKNQEFRRSVKVWIEKEERCECNISFGSTDGGESVCTVTASMTSFQNKTFVHIMNGVTWKAFVI